MQTLYNKLLELGECDVRDNWRDYLVLNFSEADTAELITLILSGHLSNNDADFFVAVHAWRVLGQLQAIEAIEPLMSLFAIDDHNDWFLSDMPIVMGYFGIPALESLKACLFDNKQAELARSLAAECIENIINKNPDSRLVCIELFNTFLEQASVEDSGVVAMVISLLAELKAIDSIDIVREAYQRNIVDTSFVGNFETAEIAFGLGEASEIPIEENDFSSEFPSIAELFEELKEDDETTFTGATLNEPVINNNKVGRNQPCPCQSGKKYKKCCGNFS